jgi:alkylation response protein AidB-like acyl-CoA dehydrogenase
MNQTPTSEDAQQLQMLRESATRFVRGNLDFKRLRERRGSAPGYDPAVLRQMSELGWLAILVPEAQGGLGLGLSELSAVVEELGRGLMADPLVPVAFATRLIARAGDGALRTRLLEAVAAGEALPVVAWQEGLGGLGVDRLSCTARRDGDGWQLDGTKRFVAGAAGATGFVVAARTDGGPGLFWVDAQAPGLALTHEWRADETPSGVLALAGVRLEAEAAVCAPGAAAAEAFERAFEDAVMLAGAEMLGVMAAALEMTLGYMRTRVQFGKPIGSFQALQHKATDLYVQQELTRAVLDEALRALDGGAPADERARAASRCKARASDAGLRVTREVIQLSGAIGFTDEYDAGLYLKRALVLSAWLGNSAAHRQRFARLQREGVVVPGM